MRQKRIIPSRGTKAPASKTHSKNVDDYKFSSPVVLDLEKAHQSLLEKRNALKKELKEGLLNWTDSIITEVKSALQAA